MHVILILQASLPTAYVFDFLADFCCLPVLMFQIVTAVLFLSLGKDFRAKNDIVIGAVTEGSWSWMGRYAVEGSWHHSENVAFWEWPSLSLSSLHSSNLRFLGYYL